MGIFSGVGIASTASYAPKKALHVKEIQEDYGFTEAYLKKIDIEKVHVADDDEYPTDMAIKAAKKAIVEAGIEPEEVDLILYSYGAFPEYFIWAEYAKVQYEIGAKNAAALRIDQACNAQIIALEYACAKIKADPYINNVLIVSADVFKEPIVSRWKNADACFFGDGASAAVIKRGVATNEITSVCNMTDGELNHLWRIPVGGTARPLEGKHIKDKLFRIDMNRFALESLKSDEARRYVAERIVSTNIATLNRLLSKIEKNKSQVNKMITYNAGKYIIQNICDMMEMDIQDTSWHIGREHGHMGPVDIFFNLDQMLKNKDIRQGQLVTIFSAGTGFSTASAAIQF